MQQFTPPLMSDLPQKKARRKGKISRAKRRKIVADQPRENNGKFAQKSFNFDQFFRSFFIARPPKNLRYVQREKASIFSRKRRRKKSVMERGFLGRLWAIFNGDYSRYRRRQARKNSKILKSLS